MSCYILLLFLIIGQSIEFYLILKLTIHKISSSELKFAMIRVGRTDNG